MTPDIDALADTIRACFTRAQSLGPTDMSDGHRSLEGMVAIAKEAEARVAALEGAGSDRRIVRIKAAEARVVELEANALVAVSWLDQAIGFISWDQTGSGIALAEKLDFARAALASPDPKDCGCGGKCPVPHCCMRDTQDSVDPKEDA